MQTRQRFLIFLSIILQLIFMQIVYADFINGGFESPYTPNSGNTFNPITGWTLTGYLFNGSTSSTIPTSIDDINLSAGTTPGGITDIIVGSTQTLNDWFLQGAVPTPTLLLPGAGSQTVMINLRSVDAPLTVSGTSGKPAGWTTIARQATAISQQITLLSSDIDPSDQKIHIRFIAAPVLENPTHLINQQPFFAIQLNNITTGRTGSNPLFFQWNFASQPGVPWNSLTSAGTNSGSNTSYQYTDWQAFDIAPGNAFLHVGDVIELVAMASGCSLGGHDGHLYLDEVSTHLPASLWVSASGPVSSTPGNNITYTYTYTNSGNTAVDNVQVVANLPVQGNPSSLPAPSTTFVSVTTPTAGQSPSCSGTDPVTCSFGTLQPGETGTFQLTVNIPSGWDISTGPVNNGNYPISGTGLAPLLGPLVQTNLVAPSDLSNLIANVSGLPTTATLGTPYSGTFSCSNVETANATADAPNASCEITNLPTGLSVTGCTISPSDTSWTEPDTIPLNETVTCTVNGTPTATGSSVVTVTTNADNNSNSTDNHVSETITVSGSSSGVQIPVTLNGSPIISPAVVCCGRPVILGPLPTPGNAPTNYFVSTHTGDAICQIGHSGMQTYLKMHARHGSCTIIAIKDGVISDPFTVVSP